MTPPTPEHTAAADAAITTRRSLRAFLPTPVPRQTIEQILAVAARAPSGTNTQPWKVYVLTGDAKTSLSAKIRRAYDDPDERGRHTEEYAYYPTEWTSPFVDRRRKVGWDLYGLLGIAKTDKAAMHAQHGRNYDFFDAPVGLMFTIDRVMRQGSWLDYGMFLQSVMVAARARGLDTCPQAAFLQFHRLITGHVGAPPNEQLVCGMSLGHADPDAVENRLVTEREPVAGFVRFCGPGVTALGAVWALPFAGLLLSIALVPVVAPGIWQRHAGHIAIGWSAAFLVPFGASFGAAAALHGLARVLLHDYLPFTLLLTALFTTTGGIHVHGHLRSSPAFNTGVLGVGALLASVVGTTGASMLLIRPLLRANAERHQRAHIVIFFIFLVGNIGGVLTPLGDPPLLLGFFRGVDFFWTARHLAAPMLFLLIALLAAFFAVDTYRHRREGRPVHVARDPDERGAIGIDGAANLLPLALIVALVVASGAWQSVAGVEIAGIRLDAAALVRDLGMVLATLLSLALTPRRLREANAFSWAPMREVAELFLGIFVTMAPVLGMLAAGDAGPFAPVVRLLAGANGEPLPAAYFWTTGLLSAFLDNAPTYLVFFGLAGGDAARLMQSLPATLAAISGGAVFMGALTYIGNAPNFMIKAIAEAQGVRMPGFFGYLAWSGTMLVPFFMVVTWVWFL